MIAATKVILTNFAGKHEAGQAEIARQKRRLVELEQLRKKAKAAYYADVLDLDEFKAEQEALKHGVAAAEAIIARLSVELDSITRALDDALRLVEDPQAPYNALPEGLKTLLIQAVCEQLWVMDTSVVGSDLTPAFRDLLAVDGHQARVERSLHREKRYARRRALRTGMRSAQAARSDEG